MSFRDKARSIREQGAAERGNYSPTQNSIPLRMYQFWANLRPQKVPTRENFCHYWRVVLIWAPLWFVLRLAEKFVTSKAGLVTVVIAAVIVAGYLLSLGGTLALQLLAGMAVGIYFAFGLVLGIMAGATRNSSDSFTEEFGWKPLLYFIVALPAYVLTAILDNAIRKVSKNTWRSIGRVVGKGIFVLFLAVAAACLIYMAVTEWVFFLMGVGAVAAAAAIIVGLSFLADFLKQKHRASVEARTTYETVDWGYYETQVAVVEPSRVAKFFMAIGDFINLVFQVIRVKKWKICPIVEIPK